MPEPIARPPVMSLNPLITCVLCGGYIIDATVIKECLHTFCRSCIVSFLELSDYCPVCDVRVHERHPTGGLVTDPTLQRLVYKLVPSLLADETRRHSLYYEKHPEQLKRERAHGHLARYCGDLLSKDDVISVAIEMLVSFKSTRDINDSIQETLDKPVWRRYLLCPVAMPIRLIKKFLRAKLSIPENYHLVLFHTGAELDDHLTLMDTAYIYSWQRTSPFRLYFAAYSKASIGPSISKPPHVNIKTEDKSNPSAIGSNPPYVSGSSSREKEFETLQSKKYNYSRCGKSCKYTTTSYLNKHQRHSSPNRTKLGNFCTPFVARYSSPNKLRKRKHSLNNKPLYVKRQKHCMSFGKQKTVSLCRRRGRSLSPIYPITQYANSSDSNDSSDSADPTFRLGTYYSCDHSKRARSRRRRRRKDISKKPRGIAEFDFFPWRCSTPKRTVHAKRDKSVRTRCETRTEGVRSPPGSKMRVNTAMLVSPKKDTSEPETKRSGDTILSSNKKVSKTTDQDKVVMSSYSAHSKRGYSLTNTTRDKKQIHLSRFAHTQETNATSKRMVKYHSRNSKSYDNSFGHYFTNPATVFPTNCLQRKTFSVYTFDSPQESDAVSTGGTLSFPRRGRGRPRKHPPRFQEIQQPGSRMVTEKRGRGRPRKYPRNDPVRVSLGLKATSAPFSEDVMNQITQSDHRGMKRSSVSSNTACKSPMNQSTMDITPKFSTPVRRSTVTQRITWLSTPDPHRFVPSIPVSLNLKDLRVSGIKSPSQQVPRLNGINRRLTFESSYDSSFDISSSSDDSTPISNKNLHRQSTLSQTESLCTNSDSDCNVLNESVVLKTERDHQQRTSLIQSSFNMSPIESNHNRRVNTITCKLEPQEFESSHIKHNSSHAFQSTRGNDTLDLKQTSRLNCVESELMIKKEFEQTYPKLKQRIERWCEATRRSCLHGNLVTNMARFRALNA